MSTTRGARGGAAWSSVSADAPALVLAMAPAALMVYLGFNSGGFFVGATAASTALLLVLLAGRVMYVPVTAEGFNPALTIAVGGLALFALWALASSRWSHSPGRALVEFDRALLYTLALVVFGAIGMEPRRLSVMMRAIALSIVIICVAGLVTRLTPDFWSVPLDPISTRLSYPVSYWNTLGLLAAIGITLCFGLTSSVHESGVVRVLAAAAIPILGSALLLTLSRAGIATAGLGVIVFAVVAHPRTLLTAAMAVVPATAIAIASTYGADLLVSSNPVSPSAQAQGHEVAAVVALCAVGAGGLRAFLLRGDDALVQLRPSAAVRRRLRGAGASALVLLVVVGAMVVDLPGKYQSFVSTAEVGTTAAGEQRARLTTATDNGRIAEWTVALDEFKRNPLHGTGAGTYPNSWSKLRPPPPADILEAHSLYAEVLGELGIIGLALLVIVLLTILVGVARRARGPDRVLFATIFAAIVAWTVAAGVDWHWEMPVVTMWVFALGGAAIAAESRKTPPSRFLGMLPRSVIAIACCAVVALVPVRLIISQNRLESVRTALEAGRCSEVFVLANESRKAVDGRPEPFEFIAGCELRAGNASAAAATMREAIARDPGNWRLHYSLAAAQARAGRDPRPALREARRLNPLDPNLRTATRLFEAGDRPSEWRRTARVLRSQIITPDV